MRETIFIDSNIIYSNGYNFQKLEKKIKKYNQSFNVITSKLCIEEFAAKVIRENSRFLGSIPDFVKGYGELFLNDNTLKESNGSSFDKPIFEAIIIKLNTLFGKSNIISIDRTNLFDTILERDKIKLAPFINSGDKGFKDSVIWLAFLNYAKENSKDKYIFVSNDDGFMKNIHELNKEFKDYTGCKSITIERKLPNLDLKTIKIEPKDKLLDDKLPENMVEFRRIANNLLEELLYHQSFNPYEENLYDELNFETFEKFDKEVFNKTINNLPSFLFAHPFNDDFSFFEVFEQYPIKSFSKISADTLTDISKFYIGIESDNLKHSFTDFLVNKINAVCYKEKVNINVSEDDLPF